MENNTESKILSIYHRFILHMRQRYKDNMLTLCFGAGVSKYWNCPTWEDLVKRISEKEEFKNIKIDKEETKKSPLLMSPMRNYPQNKLRLWTDG